MGRLPAQQRREQLLDCAAKLFSRRGYARTTTAELAKSAGVTEPIIYRHFASKRDLFVALIERAGEETIAAWRRHLKGAKDAAERLRRLLGENPMVSETGRDPYRVMLQAITVADDPEIHKAIQTHISALHAFLRTEITAAQKAHKIAARFDAALIAWLLIDTAMGYGVLSALRVEGHGIGPDGTHVQQAVERMLIGPIRGSRK
ncbi:MAG: TetR/AcrR family transcriptional regulator [Phycisphaeraceae bacterium]|nr:TetR/AcrR family transcriptional regulator [Phycisphaeraceae bacterium]